MSKSWKRARRESILAEWPVERQIEALVDAATGKRGKLDELAAAIDRIKAATPKPEGRRP